MKFALLGYAMVLLKEVFAALVNNLAEGFTLTLYLRRIGQFGALNSTSAASFIAFVEFFAIRT